MCRAFLRLPLDLTHWAPVVWVPEWSWPLTRMHSSLSCLLMSVMYWRAMSQWRLAGKVRRSLFLHTLCRWLRNKLHFGLSQEVRAAWPPHLHQGASNQTHGPIRFLFSIFDMKKKTICVQQIHNYFVKTDKGLFEEDIIQVWTQWAGFLVFICYLLACWLSGPCQYFVQKIIGFSDFLYSRAGT